MSTAHNRFGLAGGSTPDRSQVLPFSVVMFSDEGGWEQYGVYATHQEATTAASEVSEQYDCPTGVADTLKLLDLPDGPITDFSTIAVDQ